MPRTASPLRSRVVALLCLYLGAPVCAEYLYAYLSSTGDAAQMLGGLAVLAPLYGGAALLVREVAVRTGRGWRGVLGLGAAWGVLMPGVVDLSMFGAHRDDIAFWDLVREPTLVGPLGISVWSSLTFVAGHVLFSVFAPLGLLHALAPAQRGRPLLGRPGLVVVTVLLATAAALIHADGRRIYGFVPTVTQELTVVAVVVLVVVLALGPWGRPRSPHPAGPVLPAWQPVVLAVVVTVASVAVPTTWIGVVAEVGRLTVLAVVCRHWSSTRQWGPREIGLLASGLVVGQTLTGFLTPAPEDVGPLAKTISQLALLVLAGFVLVLVVRSSDSPALPQGVSRRTATPRWRTTAKRRSTPNGSPGESAGAVGPRGCACSEHSREEHDQQSRERHDEQAEPQ